MLSLSPLILSMVADPNFATRPLFLATVFLMLTTYCEFPTCATPVRFSPFSRLGPECSRVSLGLRHTLSGKFFDPLLYLFTGPET